MTALMTIDATSSTYAASRAEDDPTLKVGDFETIFLRYQVPIRGFIARRVGNYELAFDLAQDVFVKVYKALLGGIAIPRRAVSSWLYRIAVNTVIDTLPAQHLHTLLSLSLLQEEGVEVTSPSVGTTPASMYPHDEDDEKPVRMRVACSRRQSGVNSPRFEERVADHQIIERVFERLSPNYRACLWLHEYEGLSCLEIGERLRISKGAVKMRLQRGREQFLTLYREETGE